MQSGTTILGRRSRSARKHARRPQGGRRVTPRSVRAAVAGAFRRLAKGVEDKTAYAKTVEFYRSSGHDWAMQLG